MNPSVSFAMRCQAAPIGATGQKLIPEPVEKIYLIRDSIRHAWPFQTFDKMTPCRPVLQPTAASDNFVS